jgi:hypothetical protein
MGWVHDKEKRWSDRNERDAALLAGANNVFARLWSELKEHASEAKEIDRFKSLEWNCIPEARVIKLTVPGQVAMPHVKAVGVSLSGDRRKIVASGEGVELTIDINICDDSQPCLKIDGRKVDYEEAAIRILDPFLYPDFPES